MPDDLSDILQRISQRLADAKPTEEFTADEDDPDVGLFEDAAALLAKHQIEQPDILAAIHLPDKARVSAGMQRESLSELLPELPSPETTVHLLSNANRAGNRQRGFSFSTFIAHLIEFLGDGVVLSVSVWTLNHNSAAEIIQFINSGKVGAFHLCVDQYFVRREFETARLLASALRYIPHSMTVFRNHAKVICMASADGSQVVTITGSGNLSSQPRAEQYNVSTSHTVYDFYRHNLFNWAIMEAEKQAIERRSKDNL